jgi:hypothetical protein
MMRLINTKAHAIVDYLIGLILLSAPSVFDFRGQPAVLVCDIAGVIMLLNTALTAFEYGLLQVIPLRVHIAIDVVSGLALAASPWLLSFREQAYKPHFVFGITIFAIGVLSDRVLWTTVKKSEG